MNENSDIKSTNNNLKMTYDIYNNLIVELPDETSDNSVTKKNEAAKLDEIFFRSCSSKKSSGITRTLSLNGNVLLRRLGRCIDDKDVTGLLNFLRKNSDITELNLSSNNVHCPGFIEIINYTITYNQIVSLDIRNNEIRSMGINHLCNTVDQLKLQILRLSGNKFGDECSKKLAMWILKNKYLRLLDVADVDQTISSLVYFTDAIIFDGNRGNDTLKVLDVSRPNPGCMCRLDTAHIASVVGSMLKQNTCLEQLHLRKFGFSCHDIEILMDEGSRNDNLVLLDLSCNNIGDFGMELIATWLAKRPRLSGLVMAHNILTNTGATALSYGLPCSKLKYLDVSHNRINDFGVINILNSLKKSPRMRQLRIYGNTIGHETAKIVNRMLLSGVLIQENFDVKPYIVDDEWHCARYPATPAS